MAVNAKESVLFNFVDNGRDSNKAFEVCNLFKVSVQKLPPKSASLNSNTF